MTRILLPITAICFFASCAAKPKPVAYSLKVISATIPSEKASGVPWDKLKAEKNFKAEGAAVGGTVGSIVPGIGTVIGAAAGGIVGWLMSDEGDPSSVLPDPYIEIHSDGFGGATTFKNNTVNPVWNETFEVQYKRKLTLTIHLFDNDGTEGEPIGTGTFKPRKQGEEPFEVPCGESKVMIKVKPVFETEVSKNSKEQKEDSETSQSE